MNVPKSMKPMWTTVVLPEEYDIKEDILAAVELANGCESSRGKIFVPCDIGKLVGLYLAYKDLMERVNEDNSG